MESEGPIHEEDAWTLTSAAALLCAAVMATAESAVATGETAWLRGKPVATYTGTAVL